MPPDLITPAFVLVLVANAVLIVLAMRSLMPARDGADTKRRPAPRADRQVTSAAPPSRHMQEATPPSTPSALVAPADPGPPTGPAPAIAADAAVTSSPRDGKATKARKPAARTATGAAAIGAAARAAAKPGSSSAAASSTVSAGSAGAAGAAGASAASTGAAVAAGAAVKSTRRRRFSLPPLDDDHEKVNRSIESFLAGGEPAPDPGADAAPTTVALVALAPVTEDGPIDRTVADTLERELRGAARGTDRVERVAPERWQVTLAATGELAARAYLRAVRAAMEPALGDRHPPLRLVAATATVLGEPVTEAISSAERRLASALATGGSSGGAVTTGEPRAAGD